MNDLDEARVSGSLAERAAELLKESEDTARVYLRRSWLAGAVQALRNARRRANRTQKEVADALGTTQSAIARLEKDDSGRLSLHSFIDYAISCGMLPLDMGLQPIDRVREFSLARPGRPRDALEFDLWQRSLSENSWPAALALRQYLASTYEHVLTSQIGRELGQDLAMNTQLIQGSATTEQADSVWSAIYADILKKAADATQSATSAVPGPLRSTTSRLRDIDKLAA